VRISFEKGGGDLRPPAGFLLRSRKASSFGGQVPRSHRIESDASRGAHRIRPKLALFFQIPLRGKRNSSCDHAAQPQRLADKNHLSFSKTTFSRNQSLFLNTLIMPVIIDRNKGIKKRSLQNCHM
jgi:hypothetical protein